MKSFTPRVTLTLCASLLLAACHTTPPKPPAPSVVVPQVPATPAAPVAPFTASSWDKLPEWQSTDLLPSYSALQQSCRALKSRPNWQAVCSRAESLAQTDNAGLHQFFESAFSPYQVSNPDGSTLGLITGYYEPKLLGSRTKTKRFAYPIYGVPEDLLTIDLGDVYPQLKGMRLRGRLQGKKVLPYYDRADIEQGKAAVQGRELFWVDNAVELFFLQIQGSGRIELPDGSSVKIGYADQNGQPYASIGKKLIEMGELKLEQASMQGIKQWGEQHPDKLPALLAQNPSYVFFRELPDQLSAPLGALGVPLTDAYSIAVDPRTIPLGAPVFLSTTYPNTTQPLNRLMLAQDTGGAIRGAVRADFFWGYGEEAGTMAGRMKQDGQMWVLFPKGGEPAASAVPATNVVTR
ncbi:MAG: MltA domain-containing protein [Gallionella sp.]|nr:MltA domain-containing protein [Gallionella sp.]